MLMLAKWESAIENGPQIPICPPHLVKMLRKAREATYYTSPKKLRNRHPNKASKPTGVYENLTELLRDWAEMLLDCRHGTRKESPPSLPQQSQVEDQWGQMHL